MGLSLAGWRSSGVCEDLKEEVLVGPPTHVANHLGNPSGWVIFLCNGQPRRLVLFVHGFRGNSLKTWGHFPYAGEENEWFREADLLFVGYPSTRESVLATEARIRLALPSFFPAPFSDRPGMIGGTQLLEAYEDLVIVGHSQGGLVVRRLITEFVNESAASLSNHVPKHLDAYVRLFSPCTAGYRPSGFLGVVNSMPIADRIFRAVLAGSVSFRDLEHGSPMVDETRHRTEDYATTYPQVRSLRASTVWANPEHVVACERYDSDPPPLVIEGKGHIGVCKPSARYGEPVKFVETGSL